ncbi:pilin glycosylation protein [Fulvimarina pelagi HTCC2506]|uniref:Pilin glycosylation protein n=1 Tax=Fulvimarina pelagi HTCC2506 TaxID=314231 RepID=Q0FYM3_9HYPH|nr:acetyltransferase [Fulvimarina pelagi]EAU39972.1 pilin glycosylation protein [Fulvimarina pelagi HTCC2506]
MTRRLGIFGAGGHGRSVASVARAAGWTDIVFFDPDWPVRTNNAAWPIAGTGEDITEAIAACDAVHVALGDNRKRLLLLDSLLSAGAEAPALIHPTAWVCPDCSIGRGTAIMAQSAVNIGTRIGRGVIVNTGALLDHDTEIADGGHLSPGSVLAGTVSVGECAWIAVGAHVLPGIKIGSDAVVGGGALVHREVPAGVTVVGVPAHSLDT